ncbi:MAG TPA: hypothetical protein VHW95_03205 [Steroidobacteraceae bacterium]|nr:hypothetical protein [Steroidobacteraceae bacterium]
MKILSQLIAASLLGTVCTVPLVSLADAPAKHVPQKAAPVHATPIVAESLAKQSPIGQNVKPPKPRVVTAVAPKFPISAAGPHGIIFVGGKPGDGKSALNPQPIPPGHGGPGDPVR